MYQHWSQLQPLCNNHAEHPVYLTGQYLAKQLPPAKAYQRRPWCPRWLFKRVSTRNLLRRFVMAQIALLIIVSVGCGPYPEDNKSKHTGPGTVRSVDWYRFSFVYETKENKTYFIDVCRQQGMPLWNQMEFKDIELLTSGYHCDSIVEVKR